MIEFQLPTWVDLVAIALGAVTGSIIARRWGADIAGILIVAIVSGLGGGLIRDILLNRTPVALTNNALIPTAVIAALVGFLFADVTARLRNRLDLVIVLMDAAFLGIYAVIGTEKAAGVNLPAVSCVFVGVLSGVGGSLLRDVLLNREPSLLQPGALNAVAAVIGCSIQIVLIRNTDVSRTAIGFSCVGLIVLLRLASLYFGWNTPQPRDLITESRAGRAVATRVRLDRILPPEERAATAAASDKPAATDEQPTAPDGL